MERIRIAKVGRAAAWYMECVECGASLPDPKTGSFLVVPDDLPVDAILVCPECGTKHRLPVRLQSGAL
jgi:RNase P subunit RPR2